ncbi:MAG: type II restriction endonuclease [Anaerolineaceae bacterium]
MRFIDVFSNIASKRLVDVDLPSGSSHQHELNGILALRDFFSDLLVDNKFKGNVEWFYFSDNDTLSTIGSVTFYNARVRDLVRTEWRLYYSGDFLSYAKSGDILVLVRTHVNNQIFCLIFDQNYSYIHSIKKLFEIEDNQPNEFVNLTEEEINREIKYAEKIVLEQIGLDQFLPINSNDLEIIQNEFGNIDFPSTRKLSELAQRLVVDGNPVSDIDNTLVEWLDREEQLFRTIEKYVIEDELRKGFVIQGGNIDVDHFLRFSLSVQNRRKSRMGSSFENHFEKILTINQISFSRNPRLIENGISKRPDFIFPDVQSYNQSNFNILQLRMLALKSSCKERWRQILNEADKIENKHLCTLEQGISEEQLNEMFHNNVILVLPQQIKDTYQESNYFSQIINVDKFIHDIKNLQVN